MNWRALALLGLASCCNALIRFQCSQLVVERLDPLVTPGQVPSPHVHQIVGGDSFNATMETSKDLPGGSTCTTCQFSDDFSNYWTAVLYFKARNGTYQRVPQRSNGGFDGTTGGGMTVYYMQDPLYDTAQKSKVKAFQPGFRMFVGDVNARTKDQAARFRQLTYTCMDNAGSREHETVAFPNHVCSYGIMTSVRFPTCWDGVNLDSPDHSTHMSYPESGTFESGGPCPATHPVRTSQVMYEVIWDTSKFNNIDDWPADGSQPFVWSFGDETGYANHGDYVFGWKDQALQNILDTQCYATSCGGKQQNITQMNKCAGLPPTVTENIGVNDWLPELPGDHHANDH